VTTRVTTLKGYIVGYRAIFSKKENLNEINQSIHIKDIEKLTSKFYLKASQPTSPTSHHPHLPPTQETPSKRKKSDRDYHDDQRQS
jgi:hypothetical protein